MSTEKVLLNTLNHCRSHPIPDWQPVLSCLTLRKDYTKQVKSWPEFHPFESHTVGSMRLEGMAEIQASKIIAATIDQEIFPAFRKVLVTTIDERKTWFRVG